MRYLADRAAHLRCFAVRIARLALLCVDKQAIVFCYGENVLFWMPGAHSDSLSKVLCWAQILRCVRRTVRIVFVLHRRTRLVAHNHITSHAIWPRSVCSFDYHRWRCRDGGHCTEESLISIIAGDADLFAALIKELNGNGRVDSLLQINNVAVRMIAARQNHA